MEKWKEHDATELVKKYTGPLDVLIDVVWLDDAGLRGVY